jgi:hypothetical protein
LLDFKVAKWARYKLLNLCSNQLISSTNTLAASVFVPSFLGGNIAAVKFGMLLAETVAGT